MRFSVITLGWLLLLISSTPAQALSAHQAIDPSSGPGRQIGKSPREMVQTEVGSESLDAWIGQMLMVGFRGTELNEKDPFLQAVRELHLGGVILFDYDVPSRSPVRNILSARQVRKLTAQLQGAAGTPLLIAIDQEGGQVTRLKAKHGFSPTPSQAELGRMDQEQLTRSSAKRIADTLAGLGINLNFAPVLDLALHSDNPVIAALERSYGSNPDLVQRHARWTIEEFHRVGLLCAVKHFPGHGSSQDDSHLGLPDVTNQWNPIELEPFRSLILERLPDMVMTAHLYNAHWDKTYPATFSPAVVTDLLRDGMGFEGVIVSDDMQMGAITENYTLEEGIEQAIKSGIDILLFANNSSYHPRIAYEAVDILRDLVGRGVISRARIRQSYLRISHLKKKLNNK